jgi:hypothetical protein
MSAIRFAQSLVKKVRAMSEIKLTRDIPKPGSRRGRLRAAERASPVSRENEEQRLVESYLKRLDDSTLDRLGYSAEQIDRLRRGRSVRLSA